MSIMLNKLQALSNPHRFHIARVCIEKPRDVAEITEIIGLSQSATSQHLAVMRNAGLLDYTRDAQRFIYRWRDKYPNGFFATIVGMHQL